LLAKKSPTARLWLQYLEYVETLKIFIRAERIARRLELTFDSNWKNAKSVCCHWVYFLAVFAAHDADHSWLYECFIEKATTTYTGVVDFEQVYGPI